MKAALTKIAARTLIVAGVLAVAGGAAYARGIEPGVTFATQGIDLKIDSKGWYNGKKILSATWGLKNLVPGSDKFFNFDDVKPGDYGCEVISLHAKNTEAWMCIDFKNLQESENGENEPESLADTTDGPDLADGTQFFGWVDDGDGKYENGEKTLFGTGAASSVLNDKTYVIGDSKNGYSCKPNKPEYVAMCWCAGNLTVKKGMDYKSGKVVCDPTRMGNEAQTDSFSVDIELRAEPVKNKPQFTCAPHTPEPPKPCTKDKWGNWKDNHGKKCDPKGNNGVGNGEDPPPPGGGNSGNDGPGKDKGNPGGNDTAPGKNDKDKEKNDKGTNNSSPSIPGIPSWIWDLIKKNS